MKQFFSGCLGGCLGVVIGFIIFAIILVAGISQSLSDAVDSKFQKNVEKESDVKNPVLKLTLKGEIKDYDKKDVWNFNFKELLNDKDLVLPQMIRSVEVAAKDEKIKGIYIRIYPFSASIAQLEELRKALETFKQSGKWIYVYADNYFQGEYYLASVADKIVMHPEGTLMWKGIASQISFYKKALEKLDIQVQVFRHGKFKSAVEPFILDKMSDENRQQMRTLLSSVWNDVLNKVSISRKINAKTLNQYANDLVVKDAEAALSLHFIDEMADEKQVEQLIQQKVSKEKDYVFRDYHHYKYKALDKYFHSTENKVAVIYLSGQIVDYIEGNDDDEVIVPSEVFKIFKKIEDNNNIKAVVLRVNSPGGSAFASEKIFQAIKKLKSKIPIIVSFGDVAASGGYYISCGANYIFTDHNTITGSIGVFGLLPNIQNLMQKDLGIYTDTVKTNTYADFMSVLRPVQPKEYDVIMYRIEKVYDTFLSRVSEGRKLDKAYIDNIGQGRIWSGADAVRIKLADKIGTLEDAIEFAAQKAGLSEYNIIEFPKKKDPLEEFMKTFSNDDEDALQEKIIKASTGKYYKDILIFKKSLKNQQVNYLTLMPYRIEMY